VALAAEFAHPLAEHAEFALGPLDRAPGEPLPLGEHFEVLGATWTLGEGGDQPVGRPAALVGVLLGPEGVLEADVGGVPLGDEQGQPADVAVAEGELANVEPVATQGRRWRGCPCRR
jgi:hypothetical protein